MLALFTLGAFLLALGLLIAVHEYGHYRVAIACGVKVLRFSIGFGKPMVRWQSPHTGTEFVVAVLPFGGYVRMLDEREAPVNPNERHRAFNNQSLASKACIVAAGPLANLILALLLYCSANWWGVSLAAPILSPPAAGSLAEQAGLLGGERVVSITVGGGAPTVVRSFDDIRWVLARAAAAGTDVLLSLDTPLASGTHTVYLGLGELGPRDPDLATLRRIGIVSPATDPVLVEVMAGGAAQSAGLRSGDRVVEVDGRRIRDGAELTALIRGSVRDASPITQIWKVSRDGSLVEHHVTPQLEKQAGVAVGKIGALVGSPPASVWVRHGLLEGLTQATIRTGEVTALTLKMIGKMLVGDASLKHLSGPLTIAGYAGKSASQGAVHYLLFLALLSVSLAVLNLLPIPALDGGHLVYYLWESVSGRPVSQVWLDRLQRGGFILLVLLMSVAVVNDLVRVSS